MAEEFDEDLMLVAGLDKQPTKRRKRGPSPIVGGSESDSAGFTQGETVTPVGHKHRANTASKADAGGSKYPDEYDSDLMGDEEDRARLAMMSELEREMELFERGDKRKELIESQAAAKRMQDTQAAQDKAAAMRSSTRTKTINASTNAKKDALAELTAARTAKEKRTQDQQQLAQDASSDEESLSEESFDRASDDESARSQSAAPLEVDNEAVPGTARRAEYQGHAARDDEDDIELKDAQRIQLSRTLLVKWITEPFFADTVQGCLIRGRAVDGFWIASVADVEVREPGPCKGPENRVFRCPYRLENKVETTTVLLVERGAQTMSLPISLVSNSTIEQQDFDAWAGECRRDGTNITSLSEAEEAASRIKRAHSYVYTAADVQRMVEGRRSKGKAANMATHKARLQRQLEHAIENDNTELRDKMEAELAELEAAQDVPFKEDPAKPNKKDMTKLNQRNAQRNFQNALTNVSARPGGRTAQAADDVFARRSTRPMNYWATAKKGSDLQVNTGQSNGQVGDDEDDREPETPGTATAATVMQQADGSLSLKLDLSRITVLTPEQELARALLGKNWQPKAGLVNLEGKRILTLSDYRRKQGI